MTFYEETRIFTVFLNTISYYVWNIVYWTHYLFLPSLRYRRLGYLRSGHFRLCVFELYILIVILNHEKVTVIVINQLNNYHIVQFSITCIHTIQATCLTSWMCPQEKRATINIWSCYLYSVKYGYQLFYCKILLDVL